MCCVPSHLIARVARVVAALRDRPTLDAYQASHLHETALHMVQAYLNDAWRQRLADADPGRPAAHASVSTDITAGATAAVVPGALATAVVAPLEDYGRAPPPGGNKAGAKKPAKPTPAQKALSAVDTSGMKKMLAFFTKKN